MATINEIAYRMEMRARRNRERLYVIVNPDPSGVVGRMTIPDWYISAMVEAALADVYAR